MFFRYLNFIDDILKNSKDIHHIPFYLFNGILLSCHLGYSFLTINEKEIIVKNKYQEINYGFTKYLIATDDNKQLKIDTNIWRGNFDLQEKWNLLNEGEKYKVKYYGWRLPFFGMNPNIYKIQKN
jgi:hypothetical protein